MYREFERFVPALNNEEFLAMASDDMLESTIRNGRGGMYMSSWAHENGGLRDEEIEGLIQYIKNWKKEAPTFREVMSVPRNTLIGEKLYRSRCGTCHGAQGESGIGPSLNSQEFLSIASDRFLYDTIVTGRENTAMLSWSFLEKEDVANIIGFLRSWQNTPQLSLSSTRIQGDAESGNTLFVGMCSGCHGINGEGTIGPALFNKDFLAAASDQFIYNSASRGRSNSAMLSFAKEFQGIGNLSRLELNDIVAYIRSHEKQESDIIHPGISPGTPSRGKILFDTMCAGCHGTSEMGPQCGRGQKEIRVM